MKIGFVGNIYYTPKGHSYVVRDMIKLLEETDHTTHMYRIGTNPPSNEFPTPTTMHEHEEQIIPEDKFIAWLEEIKPDVCVFMEYQQWWDEDHDKLVICKERAIPTYGFLVYERLDWKKIPHYKLYTKIISPTGFQTKLLRRKGLYNAVHVPWGVDFSEFEEIPEPTRNDNKVRYYHCAGSGGVDNRKNTQSVIDAYKLIEDENTELFISHLGSKVLTRQDVISVIKYSDVVINAAKWDTLGLVTLETNACGRPVIVANTEPMTELVKENVNGFLVDGIENESKYVTCPSYEVDINELAKKMSLLKNSVIRETMQKNAKVFAEINFNWENNKKHFLKLFD